MCITKTCLRNSRLQASILSKHFFHQSGPLIMPAHRNIQFIGSEEEEFPTTLLVKHNNSYLFNCGSGIQRIISTKDGFQNQNNNRLKLKNVGAIFLTSLKLNTLESLPGVCIPSVDRNKEVDESLISIYGPSKLNEFMSICKYFSQGFPIMRTFDCEVSQTFQDVNIKVVAIPLKSHPVNECKRSKSTIISVAYLCEFPNEPGRLKIDKCKELKVPIGPLLAKLKQGHDVTLPNGLAVKSSDVCYPAIKGQRFLVIDCEKFEYIDILKNDPILAPFYNSPLDFVVHLGTRAVICSDKYKAWSRSISDTHFCPNSKTSHPCLAEIYRQSYLLSYIDSSLFKPLFKQNEFLESKPKDEFIEETSKEMNILDSFDLYEPSSKRIIRFKQDNIVTQAYDFVKNTPKFIASLDKLRESQQNLRIAEDTEPEIVFLGTGSSRPSKYRNGSCILINNLFDDKSVILDCAEGTYGQMIRMYGQVQTDDILEKLELIYVSHFHMDHHLGLAKLLERRNQLTEDPIVLILPPTVYAFYNFLKELINLNDNVRVFKTVDFIETSVDYRDKLKQALYKQTDELLENIQIVKVVHCSASTAAYFKFKAKTKFPNESKTFSVAYSGDCRPSEIFASAARHCDVLIHEATFDSLSLDHAVVKKHSTSKEAIAIGLSMKAKHTILTHFSSAFAKTPYIDNDLLRSNVSFAFDFMSFRYPSSCERFNLSKEAIKIVFEREKNIFLNRKEAAMRSIQTKQALLSEIGV